MPGEYAQSWLDWEKVSGGRVALHGSPAEIRALYDGMVQALLPQMQPFTENVEFRDESADGVPVRVYTPKGASEPLPIALWTHGGGYMIGNLSTDHLLCGAVAEHTKSAVVNVDYRLSPEHKWPAQLDDSLTAYKWAYLFQAVKNASSFGGDPSKIFTIGGSAGGALALQIANQIVKDPSLKSTIKGVAALVPATVHPDNVPTKYKSKYKAYTENAKDVPVIDRESMEIFYKHLAAAPTDESNFTLLATENHKNFPPVYLTSCEFDPLRDDAYLIEDALKEAGVPTKHDFYPGLPHYFWIIPAVPEGKQFVANLFNGIGWLKSQF